MFIRVSLTASVDKASLDIAWLAIKADLFFMGELLYLKQLWPPAPATPSAR